MDLQLSEKLKMKSLDENIALETHLQLQTREIKLQLDEILRLTDKLVEDRIRRIKAYLNCVRVVVRQKLKKSSFSNRALMELVCTAGSLEERVTKNTRFIQLTDKLVEGRIRRIKAYLNCVQVVVRQKLKKSSFSNRALMELVRTANSLEERVTENTRFIQKVKELNEVVENLKVDIRELWMQRIENYTGESADATYRED
ncbi:uncharacterized protein LOC112453753 [Temnothorax curvispinosus]|uniref:Uncharacterized protein LOC112453753 n=1 Tax=Temnothorax curvispinosus TaxID=300111 RepID=A0A6J1PLA5_9HYME|nr:uncharacterized protein LOC112453753 [Temnothorax curvispinosus]